MDGWRLCNKLVSRFAVLVCLYTSCVLMPVHVICLQQHNHWLKRHSFSAARCHHSLNRTEHQNESVVNTTTIDRLAFFCMPIRSTTLLHMLTHTLALDNT
ncbi:unnamed protein product [Ectocarpus sp. 4 AP-2014]